MRSLAKINLTAIFKAHFNTLVDSSTKQNKASISDRFWFFALPALLSFVAAYFIVPTDKNILGVLITSLSIFAGLLFNLLVLVMQIIGDKKGDFEFIRVQKQTYANIAYAILISLLASIILLVPYFFEPEIIKDENTKVLAFWVRPFWGIVYFLLINFALTMAMILKRMHSILVRLMDY